jgi:hypothetical protein
MLRTLVIAGAVGLAAVNLLDGRAAFADNLVPGGWLQPIQLPKWPPPPPAAAAAATTTAPAPAPARAEERRPIIRSRIKERHPAPPHPETAPSDGKIRF